MTTNQTLQPRRSRIQQLRQWLSGESLTQKASLNALAEMLDYLARLIVGFVTNPLLVRGLGDYAYGEWQVLGQLIGYISPATGRPTQALKWTVANKQASADLEDKRRQVGNAVAVWLIFLPLLLTLGGLLAWYSPNWLDARPDYYTRIRLTSAVLVANLIAISLVDIPRAVLKGENLGYRRMGLSALLIIVGGGLTIGALYLNFGLIGVASATLATTLLTGFLFMRVAKVYVPWFGIARPSRSAVRKFLKLSGWFLVWTLIMRVMRTGDVIVLRYFDSAELVTNYTLSRYVPETIISIVAMVVFGITPGLGGIIGSGQLDKAIRVRSEIMSFTWLLVTAMGATILLWNQSFVNLWVGEAYYIGSLPLLFVIIMMMQFVLIRNDANIIDLTLNLRDKVLLGTLSAGVSVAIASVLIGRFDQGIIGLCAGFICGRLLLTIGYPWLIGKMLGSTLLTQIASVPRPALVTTVLFIAVLYWGQTWVVASWFQLIIVCGLTFCAVAIIAFFSGLAHNQRTFLLNRIVRILP